MSKESYRRYLLRNLSPERKRFLKKMGFNVSLKKNSHGKKQKRN